MPPKGRGRGNGEYQSICDYPGCGVGFLQPTDAPKHYRQFPEHCLDKCVVCKLPFTDHMVKHRHYNEYFPEHKPADYGRKKKAKPSSENAPFSDNEPQTDEQKDNMVDMYRDDPFLADLSDGKPDDPMPQQSVNLPPVTPLPPRAPIVSLPAPSQASPPPILFPMVDYSKPVAPQTTNKAKEIQFDANYQ